MEARDRRALKGTWRVAIRVGRKDEALLYSHFVGKRQNLTSIFCFLAEGVRLSGGGA